MIKKYNQWFSNLTPIKKYAVSFALNWFYWLTAWLIAEQFFFDENRSWLYHISHATWMSFFMTSIFNWKEFKQIFKRQNFSNNPNQNPVTDPEQIPK